MSIFGPDDLDEDDLEALSDLTEEDLDDLYDDDLELENPLDGYARPATRAPRLVDPYREVVDLRPL
ncbi:hypothetical protein [Streptomyces sp. NPDC050145]|uniref:hypothetical protein n=1 Tax=Streptomyces sp. NPDC050145 TaxID=3365602 RepID=UPI0037A77E5A